MNAPNEMTAGVHSVAHIKSLDGLRGYAAIIVTFYHAILHINPFAIQTILSPAIDQVAIADIWLKIALIFFDGATAVSLFYVLSGVVLCQSLLRSGLGAKSILLFLLRRILRLYPALIFCVFSMWVLSIAMQEVIHGFPLVDIGDAVYNSLLIHTKVHSPSTSVQVEVLATPFIILFAIAYKKYSVAACLVLLALSMSAMQRNELVFFLPNIHASLLMFFAGMLIALPEAKAFFKKIVGWKLFSLLVLAFIIRHLTDINFLPGYIAKTLLLAGVVGFLRWAEYRTFLHEFLENDFSQFIGKISYSYYLLNIPILWLLWFLPAVYSNFSELGQLFGGIVSGFFAVMLTIPLAYLSYRFVEVYFINFGAKITRSFGG